MGVTILNAGFPFILLMVDNACY